jgi:hypothetical protein
MRRPVDPADDGALPMFPSAGKRLDLMNDSGTCAAGLHRERRELWAKTEL